MTDRAHEALLRVLFLPIIFLPLPQRMRQEDGWQED